MAATQMMNVYLRPVHIASGLLILSAVVAPGALGVESETPNPEATENAPPSDPESATTPASPAGREAAFLSLLERGRLDEGYVALTGDPTVLAFARASNHLPATGGLLVVGAKGRFIGADRRLKVLIDELTAGGWGIVVVQPPLNEAPDTEAYRTEVIRRASLGLKEPILSEGQFGVVMGLGGQSDSLEHWLLENKPSTVHAYVSSEAWDGGDAVVQLPTLEIVAELSATAQAKAEQRYRRFARDANAGYERRIIPGAQPDYAGVETSFARVVRGWLKKKFDG